MQALAWMYEDAVISFARYYGGPRVRQLVVAMQNNMRSHELCNYMMALLHYRCAWDLVVYIGAT